MDQNQAIAKKTNTYAYIGITSSVAFMIPRCLDGTWYLVQLIACSIALFTCARALTFFNKNQAMASHLVVIGAYIVLAGAQFKDGGKNSISLWLVCIVPLMAGDLLGLKQIIPYSLLGALGISFPWLFDLFGLPYPDPIPLSDAEIVLMRSIGVVGIAAVCLHVAKESDARVVELAQKRGEVYKTHQQAESLNQQKTAFLRQMSREIRAPLNGIKGMTQVWVRQDLDSDSAESVATMDRCANNLLSIINDAQDLSRTGEQSFAIESYPFSIPRMVQDVITLFSGKAREKNIELVACGSSSNEFGVGDEKRLTQVLSNLVGNAIKFSDNGRVELRWEWTSGGIRFEVKDQGIGMTENQLDSLFLEFTQVHEEESTRRGGTGLGLTISKSLIEAMGGTMRVESQAGSGSCFKIELPMQTTNFEAPEERTNKQIELARIDARILLLDDDLASLWVQRLALESMGCTVDCTKTTSSALELVRRRAFDLAIVDLRMPDTDGINALALLREQTCNPGPLPAIALTASAEPDDKEACLEAGFAAVLVKPFDYAELQRAVAKHRAPTLTPNLVRKTG